MTDTDLMSLTADIVVSHVSNNSVGTAELPSLIQSVHASLQRIAAPAPQPATAPAPPVPIARSVKPDYIICLEDGKKLTMLKRYLRVKFDMTPEDYRKKWGLPANYPMVAPLYAEKRRQLAKQIGLGSKGRVGAKAAPAPVEPVATPAKPGRRKKVEAAPAT